MKRKFIRTVGSAEHVSIPSGLMVEETNNLFQQISGLDPLNFKKPAPKALTEHAFFGLPSDELEIDETMEMLGNVEGYGFLKTQGKKAWHESKNLVAESRKPKRTTQKPPIQKNMVQAKAIRESFSKVMRPLFKHLQESVPKTVDALLKNESYLKKIDELILGSKVGHRLATESKNRESQIFNKLSTHLFEAVKRGDRALAIEAATRMVKASELKESHAEGLHRSGLEELRHTNSLAYSIMGTK